MAAEGKVEAPAPSARPVAEVKPQKEVEAPKPADRSPVQPRAPPEDAQIKEVARIIQQLLDAKIPQGCSSQVAHHDTQVSSVLSQLDEDIRAVESVLEQYKSFPDANLKRAKINSKIKRVKRVKF